MRKSPANSALTRWHRRIGLVAAALIVVLALSGVALNHTQELELDQPHFTAPWLMEWYGLTPEGDLRGYTAGGHWVLGMENSLFLDTSLLPHAIDTVVGAVAKDNNLIVAGKMELLILSDDGALIERISTMPAPIEKIGLTQDERIAISVTTGQIFTSGTAMLEWRLASNAGVKWASPGDPPDYILDQYYISYRGAGVNLERIILDLHSGRILGRHGPWLMDGAAILLLGLAATGLIGWLRTRNGNGANDQP